MMTRKKSDKFQSWIKPSDRKFIDELADSDAEALEKLISKFKSLSIKTKEEYLNRIHLGLDGILDNAMAYLQLQARDTFQEKINKMQTDLEWIALKRSVHKSIDESIQYPALKDRILKEAIDIINKLAKKYDLDAEDITRAIELEEQIKKAE